MLRESVLRGHLGGQRGVRFSVKHFCLFVIVEGNLFHPLSTIWRQIVFSVVWSDYTFTKFFNDLFLFIPYNLCQR